MVFDAGQDGGRQEEKQGLRNQVSDTRRKVLQRKAELAALKTAEKVSSKATGVVGKQAGRAGGKVAAKTAGVPVQVGEKALAATGVGAPVAAAIMAARLVAEKGVSEATGQIAKQASRQLSKAPFKPLIAAQKRRVKKAQQNAGEAEEALAEFGEDSVMDIVDGKIRKVVGKFVSIPVEVAFGLLLTVFMFPFVILAVGIVLAIVNIERLIPIIRLMSSII
ncbi:MAG: hypothetical protein A3E37_00885 [Candidatus Andersenbacteria bacterium RIFCSPHIGHO2_12_FULL_46_9]|nr:MAG: hypothetical protein UW94_C0001G0107 [Parcubacteria group bacterium GW2011_GWA2_45_14]OGY35750.1 MAG: hypothetical protein A3B76_03495 [Candidatus Andersenbacteria bacterium RIFCSPHIGHO2_02_FULL_46_16]OGY37481.1 MAG: hypothetical protein A3I08_00415 [Candidatus Andersenbacteria bacterium RIFCSPLOWO2_02_FULL_46_11]OGY37963.1 MAG: hypothetical protein A3E37_00885 [Candidatus Andersenbacteria bacterium RIFCSPHIGHO2_12_FULL_46_9]HBE90153.1 hypothetical protein [Candidatus Andersenbacteria b